MELFYGSYVSEYQGTIQRLKTNLFTTRGQAEQELRILQDIAFVLGKPFKDAIVLQAGPADHALATQPART